MTAILRCLCFPLLVHLGHAASPNIILINCDDSATVTSGAMGRRTPARRTFERAAQQLAHFRSEDEINFLLLTSLTSAAPKTA